MADPIARFDPPGGHEPASAEAAGHGTQARVPLGELLKRAGFIDDGQLDEALSEGALTGERLGEIVTRRAWASEDDVAKLLAEQWELGYVDRASIWFEADALARMSRPQARRLEALPTRIQDGRVVVAVAEPTEQRLAALREVIGEDTVVVVVPKTALDAGLSSELLSDRGDPAASDSTDESPDAAQEAEPSHDLQPEHEDEHDHEHEDHHEHEDEDEHEHVEAPHEPPPPPVALVAVPDQPREPQDLPAPVGSPAAAADGERGDADVTRALERLRLAAGEAASLRGRVDDLAAELEQVAAALASGTADDRARIDRLEEQLGHRTELTERLKSQLGDLTRTLATLD